MTNILIFTCIARVHWILAHQRPAKLSKLAIDCIVELNHVRPQHSKDKKCPNEDRQCVLLHMIKVYPQAAGNKRKLTDLRQIECCKSCQALAPTNKVDYKIDADPAHRHYHRSHDERFSNHFEVW